MQIECSFLFRCGLMLAFATAAGSSQQTMPMDPSMPMGHAPERSAPPALPRADGQRPITEPTMPQVDEGAPMHMHMRPIAHVMPQLPVIGRSKRPEAATVYTLEQLERMALERNPTLRQAQQNVDAARGIRRQVGLPPNPSIGYYGDEIRGGSYRSGKQGFFIDQPIITGGKLGLNRKIEDQAIHQMEAASAAQRLRVQNATRLAYYQVLTAQELLNIKRDLAGIAHATAEYTRQLGNTGQADETEVLQTEVAEQQMLIAAGVQENMLHRAWIGLASAVGESQLPAGAVQGDIEALPVDPDDSKLLEELLRSSPAVQYALASLARAEAELKRARREPVPNISARGGVSQDNEPLDQAQSRTGLVGFAEIGAQIHLFDRNQGNIDADRAEVERARQEVTRTELALRDRSAAVAENYRSARLVASRYRDEILPRTQRGYLLIAQQYGLMDASFARVLNLQRELYSAEVEYLHALESAQTSYVELNGFLYSGGLDMPQGAETPISQGSAGGPSLPAKDMAPHDLNYPNAQSSLFDSGMRP